MADPIAKMRWYQVTFDDMMNFSSADAEVVVTADNITTVKRIHYDTPHTTVTDGTTVDLRPNDAIVDAIA